MVGKAHAAADAGMQACLWAPRAHLARACALRRRLKACTVRSIVLAERHVRGGIKREVAPPSPLQLSRHKQLDAGQELGVDEQDSVRAKA